ncbi:MAG TPA: hypothetical protein DCQ26_15000 [Marinilabiliales bacterium]|jgi:hypothetical protein|nr:MAG: hypothetical protein A2W95_17715 [Bacteroidetes bacterium GWA2_40_14]OFX56750.1 MAG: hypothetical protein A2W84_05795 [Bacteroidetes bacterium GWC2_40_13]OFX72846.1 MAG: hypothetical protein A2W96_19245 [Bacteroidetes bacterium GWD2_40_43]OFX93539.1 MAG: hypothetical protein A2W97_14845 [Bacteroidetes bacterium GWE2_40_63]OFY18311.1 MAG: hypothetical protein A2W88_05005 [Bacteroidetes bacterium GWF2_40_13]OFZ27508.1 MAG: hypothetical protein A2437_14240 [Bacteroidetes bacterium RIFOXYC
METPVLREKDIFPSKEVLEIALGDSYLAFEELIQKVTDTQYGLEPVWNYYNDGKAWLCKVCYKKKTIFWLSVWDKYFKTGFYFTEKTGLGIKELEIDNEIKESFNRNKPIGKLIPLTITISLKEQISDVLKVIEFKKSLK